MPTAISESEVLIIRTLLDLVAQCRSCVIARSNRYSETVFSTSSIFLPARSFNCRPLRTSRASLPFE